MSSILNCISTLAPTSPRPRVPEVYSRVYGPVHFTHTLLLKVFQFPASLLTQHKAKKIHFQEANKADLMDASLAKCFRLRFFSFREREMLIDYFWFKHFSKAGCLSAKIVRKRHAARWPKREKWTMNSPFSGGQGQRSEQPSLDFSLIATI